MRLKKNIEWSSCLLDVIRDFIWIKEGYCWKWMKNRRKCELTCNWIDFHLTNDLGYMDDDYKGTYTLFPRMIWLTL